MKSTDLCEYVAQEPFVFDGVFVADYLLRSVTPEHALLITAVGFHKLTVQRGAVVQPCEFKFARSKLRMVCARIAVLLAEEHQRQLKPYGDRGMLGCLEVVVQNSNLAPVSLALTHRGR